VYSNILKIAVVVDGIDSLHLSQSDVETWTTEWSISDEERSSFLKMIVDAHVSASNQYVTSQL
jgi:translation initiation factor 3 subunit M